jgi:hypothetical protein
MHDKTATTKLIDEEIERTAPIWAKYVFGADFSDVELKVVKVLLGQGVGIALNAVLVDLTENEKPKS